MNHIVSAPCKKGTLILHQGLDNRLPDVNSLGMETGRRCSQSSTAAGRQFVPPPNDHCPVALHKLQIFGTRPRAVGRYAQYESNACLEDAEWSSPTWELPRTSSEPSIIRFDS